MWSIKTPRRLGSLPARRIILFVSAILLALFAAISLLFTPVGAQQAIDATWSGENIIFDGRTYEQLDGIPDEEPFRRDNTCGNARSAYANYTREGDNVTEARIICFRSEDSATRTTANFLYFPDASGSGDVITYGELYIATDRINDPNADRSLTIGAVGETIRPPTSCDSTYTHGLGWVICPLTNFLAAGMDWLYNTIKDFLIVQPVSTDRDSALYQAWGMMRNLANILFVVAFLIIIYSQITGIGLSNYGVKRLMPRLLMAAVLVNISYWITAVAVDISNLSGQAFQDMFMSIRANLVEVGGPGAGTNVSVEWNWATVAGIVLSGGAAAFIGYNVIMAGVGASIILLLPTLLSVILSAMVAMLVLAGRQALVTVLVILSPIAFVAYLLPNTEKYFDKWKDLFITMLLVFPLFSVIFGGAQLAGTAIIHNSGDTAQNISVVILGMAVQVIPLAITPLLLSISGSLLGRLAGFTNNPNRGLIDQARKYTDKSADSRKARRLAEGRGLGARTARWFDDKKRGQEGWTKVYEEKRAAQFANSNTAHKIHYESETAKVIKNIGDQKAEKEWKDTKDNRVKAVKLQQMVLSEQVKQLTERESAEHEELKAGVVSRRLKEVPEIIEFQKLAVEATTRHFVESSRKSVAGDEQKSNFAQAVEASDMLATEAGGIQDHAAMRARVSASVVIERGIAESAKAIIESSEARNDQGELHRRFIQAMRESDATSMRAHASMLVETGSGGVKLLRQEIGNHEGDVDPSALKSFKRFVSSNGDINVAAEDIANWSREDAPLADKSADTAMWLKMKPGNWANMAQSSQIVALDNGGLTPEMAYAIYRSPDAFGKLKTTGDRNIQEAVTNLAQMDPRFT